MSFSIKVPASSANIGPGFDVLGIGLNLFLEIQVKISPEVDTSEDPHNCKLSYEGEGSENVPLISNKNLVTQTALYVLRCNNIDNFPLGTHIHVKNPIPLGRGLGSSGAAIVGGVMLGNEIGKFGFDKTRLLDYCLLIERHPDNIAAAMLGGFIGSYLNELSDKEMDEKSVDLQYILPKSSTDLSKVVKTPPPNNIGEYIQYKWNSKIKCIAIIPDFEVKTDDARAVLPESYTRPDIIFNLQRLAILTNSLGNDPPNNKLIYNSMKDKIHQPYRASLIPGLQQVLKDITPDSNKSVCGICLSGAGPTILCLATDDFDTIANSIMKIFNDYNVHCSWKLLDLAYDGAVVNN